MATGWFFHSDSQFIKRENMKEWLMWAFFGSNYGDLRQEWVEELEGYLTRVEEYLGCKLEDGWSDTAKCMRSTLDPVVTVHRPLIWYTIVALVDTITCSTLLSHGFKHYDNQNPFASFPWRWVSLISRKSLHPDIAYWYRPHRSKTKQPIIFLHGIGIGLWPYVRFFFELLVEDPEVGIIAVENLAVSMRISQPPLPREVMLSVLLSILDHHNLPRIVLAAHSYGTVLAAHILRDPIFSKRVVSMLLVDPIPFLLYLPGVAHNFVYRQPRRASEWQLWYFASRDPDISRALSRHFFWVENVLWKEDLDGRENAVVLCGKDQIADADEVRRYLTGTNGSEFRWRKDGLEVLYYPHLDHSKEFDTSELRRPMVEILSRFVRSSGTRESIPNGYT
ncbi:uncharacterized protein FIBRA_07341 [Fibroporia radiculosa]|uniref:AB hydrolase-1 domain-containing protein n=1 Tax=Fibroporia radiculosa TaxID=599839 RepID=J4GE57_9APHY|nr:uncharacterized protein FIBRA_07341 [Fibroporia radiculosa]CCM05133.1 predicted protein [Fibroporia radiculosa]